jgi:uncharacterized membrane protein
MRTFIRIIAARPRLILAALAGCIAYAVLPTSLGWLVRSILAWDFCCAVFLVACAAMFSIEPMVRILRDARRDQEGEWTIFWFTIAAVAASFSALIDAFSQMKGVSPEVRGLHIAMVVGTLLLSWLMTHTLFALRYAHEYYDGPADGSKIAGGLEFPGGAPPDYWDFFYFALVLGMTFQVSDVQITSRSTRRLATAHGLIGFLFNTVLLALSVNIGASLLQ